MDDKILKGLVDLIYGTGRVRKKFELENPNEKVLAADASKGIVTTNQEIRHGLDWVTSQRAVILLTDKRIVCGKWTIPLESVSAAQLIKINSIFGRRQILKIQTESGINYQFGMQFNPEWTEQPILPLTLEEGQIKYSFFSIIVRLILVGCLLYWIYELFMVN